MDVIKEQKHEPESQIRRQLRQRRYLTDNELEDIKPFRRYRKPGEDAQEKQNKYMQSGSSYKLKRQYPTHDAVVKQGQSSPKLTKYKYDTTVKEYEKATLTGNYDNNFIPKSTPENEAYIPIRASPIKKNISKLQVSLGMANSNNREQVQSIIFDSKVRKIESFETRSIDKCPEVEQLVSNRNLSIFQAKAHKVNEEIQAGLTNLEKMIEQLKIKKVEQSQSHLQAKTKDRMLNIEKQFAERRAEARQRQAQEQQQLAFHYKIKGSPIKYKQSEDTQQLLINILEKQKRLQESIERANSPMKQLDEGVADSQIELQGDFKFKAKNFPPEYTTLINRLSKQIQKDIEFTNKVNDLTKAGVIEPVTKLILLEISKHRAPQVQIEESFFRIEPSEMNPLEQGRTGWYKKFNEYELEEEGIKLYKLYKDIQTHFKIKLQAKFSPAIITLLFEELSRFNFTKDSFTDNSSVTVGHLLSYLNMRTNKSFRNRSFVKMLKRLELRPNSFLNQNALKRFVS